VERFVASLAIPDDRKGVVLAELQDHLACAIEAAVREGRDPDAAGRAAIGDLGVLRRLLESVEPAFQITRWRAFGRGVVASLLVALVLDQGGGHMRGALGALAAIAIAAVFAPPRLLDLLRGELRAPGIRGSLGLPRGTRIGAALTYGFTVMSGPFLVWISLIVVRARAGTTSVDVPWSAFALMIAVYLVVLVEGFRARRTTAV